MGTLSLRKKPGGSQRGKGVGTNGGGREGKKKKKGFSKKVLDVLRNAVGPLGKYISVRRSLPAACTRPAPRPARISPAARQLRAAPRRSLGGRGWVSDSGLSRSFSGSAFRCNSRGDAP